MAGILPGWRWLSNDVTIVVDGKTKKVQVVERNITGELNRVVGDMRKHGMKEWAAMYNMKNAVPEGRPYHSGFLHGYKVGREIERKKLD